MKKKIENMSTEEILEDFRKSGGMTVPRYQWRHNGMRTKLNNLSRKGLLRKKSHKGYDEFSLPPQ